MAVSTSKTVSCHWPHLEWLPRAMVRSTHCQAPTQANWASWTMDTENWFAASIVNRPGQLQLRLLLRLGCDCCSEQRAALALGAPICYSTCLEKEEGW